MIQDGINKLLTNLGVASLESGTSEKNEMAKKAEESLKENATAKLNQKTNFEEYKNNIYNKIEED